MGNGQGRRRRHTRNVRIRPDKQVRAEVIARAALRTIRSDIQRSRATAPGPAVSGYGFLSAAVGPDLAALLPGTLTPYGTRPHATLGGVATDLLQFSPYLRTPYAVARAVRAARVAKSLEAGFAERRGRLWNGVAMKIRREPRRKAVPPAQGAATSRTT